MTRLTPKQLAEFDNKDWWGEEQWKQWKQEYDKCMAFRKTIKGKPTPEQEVAIEANARAIEYYEFRLWHTNRWKPCSCGYCAKGLFLPKPISQPVPSRITKIPLDKANRMVRLGFGKHEGKWFVRVDLWWVGFRLTR